MSLTIDDVLALDPLSEGRPEVIAGAGLLDRTVRWVHVSQLTDLTGLLRGGELVLTTADTLCGEAVPPEGYLRHLAETGAAGVVIEPPDPDAGFAARLRTAAAGLDFPFPVVLLARAVRFVEITEAVHSRIVGEQYDEVRFARRTHEVFTALSLEAAPPDVIVARAAELAETAVVYEDVAHRVLASAAGPRGGGGTDLLADWERRARLAADAWRHVPVDVHGQRWGRLVMPDGEGDQERLGMVLERAAQALTLRLMTEQSQADVALRAQSGLISELVAGRAGGEAEALVRARAVGLRPGARYVPVAVRYAADAAPDSAEAVEALARDREFVAAVARTVAAAGLSALTSSGGIGEIALVLSCPRADDEERLLDRFATALGRQLPGRGPGAGTGPEPGPGPCVGVADAQPTLTGAARRLAEAAHIAEVAAAMTDGDGHGPRRPYHRAEHLRLRGLLSLLRDNRHVRAFAESELHRLLDHEARHASGHLALLRQYLEVNGNKNELARRMSLSRPALYARLATLERVLGVRLDDPETRASLYVALLVRELEPN